MASVLFLFLMSAAAETLESAWKQAGIEVLTMAHTSDNELDTGYVQGHTPRMYTSSKLTAYDIYQLLCVNNGTFPFPTRAALMKGLTLVHSHLTRFGLEVLIGRSGNPSKTECIFFPPPQFFDDIQFSAPALTDDVDGPCLLYQDPNSDTLCPSKQESEETEKDQTLREDAKYDALPETDQIVIADGYVTFCRKFKHLGSRISYNLRDDSDIEA
jgi:hypothetical protein